MKALFRKYLSSAAYLADRRRFFVKRHVSPLLDRSLAVLTFDVDSSLDVDALPATCGLLERWGLRAGFAVVGHWVERRPEEHRMIAEGGHEVMNHGLVNHCPRDDGGRLYSANFFSDLDLEGKTREVRLGHEKIAQVLGVEPRGFRAAHFCTLARGELAGLYPRLAEMGYLYSSSSIHSLSPDGSAAPSVASGVVELPLSSCPEHPFSPFDSWHFLEAPERRHKQGDLARCLAYFLDLAHENAGFFVNIYLDPRAAAASREAGEMMEALAASRVEMALPSALAGEILEGARA